jgi:hypothetical protein
VTYINLAVSGALIADLRPQLDQLSTLVGVRTVDAVLISIGGNDAGFENAIAAYLLHEPVDNFPDLGPPIPVIEQAIRDGDWTPLYFADLYNVLVEALGLNMPGWKDVRGLNGMERGYEEVASAFAEHGINPAHVYILQYPDPFVADSTDPDAVCPDEVLTAVFSSSPRQLEIGRQEQRSARDSFIVPLNQQIAASAQQAGWNLVKAERVMYGHAICQDDRMVARYRDSLDLQGDKQGTLHPNKSGYEAIAVPAINVLIGGTP